jgi:MarR family transcriptional regulator, lower aerobic nicotinate degradation pathway regulator
VQPHREDVDERLLRACGLGELATFLQLDKSSVTGLVDRAAERGLVVRTASPVDRRSVRVAITEQGRRLIDEGAAALESQLAVLVADLTPAERTRLSVLASRVVAADALRRGIDIHAGVASMS